jgi:hypothetical protein
MKKASLLLLLPLIIGIGALTHLGYLYFHQECGPKDFSYSYPLSSDDPLPIDSLEKEQVKQILSQHFTYLGRGKQMTAFLSADDQYVIKFFNPRGFVRDTWFQDWHKCKRLISMKWISHAYLKRKARLRVLADRHRMAFSDLRKECGLLYIHVNESTKLELKITVTDKDQNEVVMNLLECPFVLQKKATIATDYLDTLLEEGQIQACEHAVMQIADLFFTRAIKGYTDRIQTLHNNYGFHNGDAVQIDFGRITKSPTDQPIHKEELARIFHQLQKAVIPSLLPIPKQCSIRNYAPMSKNLSLGFNSQT